MNPYRSVVKYNLRNVTDTEAMGIEKMAVFFSKEQGSVFDPLLLTFPRRIEDTYKGRVLTRLNRKTPMESRQRVAKPQGAVNSPVGVGSPKKRMPTCNRPDRAIPKVKTCRRGTGGLSKERCKESKV